jgi:hypothetical protein
MKIENLSYYGKGLVDISADPEYQKFKNRMVMPFMKLLYTETSLFSMAKMRWKVRKEKNKMKKHDWSDIERQGFSKENLNIVIEDIAYMKVLVDMLGENKACSIFSELIEEINDTLSSEGRNVLLIPANEMESCKDKFIAFKEFMKSVEDAMEKEGSHKIDIVRDTDDILAYNVKYCIAHEVAKEFGDPIFCFSWCHIDDVAFPKVGEQLGFKFERIGTLRSGATKCDFKFSRIKNSGEFVNNNPAPIG